MCQNIKDKEQHDGGLVPTLPEVYSQIIIIQKIPIYPCWTQISLGQAGMRQLTRRLESQSFLISTRVHLQPERSPPTFTLHTMQRYPNEGGGGGGWGRQLAAGKLSSPLFLPFPPF